MKVYPIVLEKDYPTLQKWWSEYKWTPVAPEFLPKNGFIVRDSEKDIVAGFCYFTDSPIMLFEWVIGNPELSSEERKNGLSFLIRFVKLWAAAQGAKQLLTMTGNNSFIKNLEDNGFMKTDENVTHLLGVL